MATIKNRAPLSWLIALLALSVPLLTGCEEAPATFPAAPSDPFTTTYSLGEEGRRLSLSGSSAGHAAGKESEFQLRLDNRSGDDSWQGEYCILLLDSEGVVKEIDHEQFEVPVGLETEEQVTVQFPEGSAGPIGLCVVIPQRASVVTTLWVGEKGADSAGPWPDVSTCP